MNLAPAREAAMHAIVASMRFPGPDYYEVLRWLHEDLRPVAYIEIGVCRGRSLSLALPPTAALGIDPYPEIEHPLQTQAHVLATTSKDFFATHSPGEFLPSDHFSLALVDGLHEFEQTVEDILNLERFAQPASVIAVHDTIPLDEKTASPVRCTQFHTGDVWKVIPFLREQRPDLEMITIRTAPSGLTLIRRFDPSRQKSSEDLEALQRFRDLSWEYYTTYHKDFLVSIPNDRAAVKAWLCGTSREPK